MKKADIQSLNGLNLLEFYKKRIMYKVATNIKKFADFGVQFIYDEGGLVIGVNLLCKKHILYKKRFVTGVIVSSKKQETEMVSAVIENIFTSIPKY